MLLIRSSQRKALPLSHEAGELMASHLSSLEFDKIAKRPRRGRAERQEKHAEEGGYRAESAYCRTRQYVGVRPSNP